MTVSTHVATALGVTTATMALVNHFAGYSIQTEHIAQFIIFVLIGAVFPDIDEPESWIGKRTIIISHFIKFLFGHRGMTHTLLSTIIILAVPMVYSLFIKEVDAHFMWMVYGFTTGWLMHSVGDAHTKGGIPIFLPFKKKKYHILPKTMRFKTNTWVEHMIYAPLYNLMTLASSYLMYVDGYISIV